MSDYKILWKLETFLVVELFVATVPHTEDFEWRHYLVVPRHSLSSYGRRAFAVAGPTVWYSLSDDLRDPMLSTDSFRRLLKTRLFPEY